MDGYNRFYCGEVYQRVPKAYAEWCENEFETSPMEMDGDRNACWRTGQQIAEAIEMMELTK
jgi:hypothetical protein